MRPNTTKHAPKQTRFPPVFIYRWKRLPAQRWPNKQFNNTRRGGQREPTCGGPRNVERKPQPMSKQHAHECADWLRQHLRQHGPTPRAQVIAAAAGVGFTAGVVQKAARHIDVLSTRDGTSAVWSLPERRLTVVSAADITTETAPEPWRCFPHCPQCHERLWAVTFYRHPQDPRGRLEPPTTGGRCPHCDVVLYAIPSVAADAMEQLIGSMR